MGFALWIDGDTAWCAGTHEYRPMGVAVAAATGLFSERDFHRRRPLPALPSSFFRGYFASLVHVNRFLAAGSVTDERKKLPKNRRIVLSTF